MDDFELQYADELAEFDAIDMTTFGPTTKGRKSLDFSTPSTKHIRSRVKDIDASFNDTLTLDPLESVSDREEGTSEPNNSYGKSLVMSGKENLDGNINMSGSRKRGFLNDEDSDDEKKLVIDAEIPEIAPRSKKARIHRVLAPQTAASDEDFDISPPPSPRPPTPPPIIVHEIPLQKRQARNKHTMALERQHQDDEQFIQNYDLERTRVHKKIPPGAYMNVTNEDGKRVYMKVHSEEVLKQSSKLPTGSKTLQLLGTSLYELKAQVKDQRAKRLLDESERLNQIVNVQMSEADGEGEDSDVEMEDGNPSLWVDRYRPRRYVELLSDESTNRTLLKWLKLWDHVVFGKVVKDSKRSQGQDRKKPETKFVNKKIPEVSAELDGLKRPMFKIALLAGPPGLGKTTMAHIVAKHAGYNVVEMNASDDRSAEVFKQRIETATRMKSVLGPDPRPNCLIIDEIDGAPQPAINVLLSIIKQGDKLEAAASTTIKKRKKEGEALLRPIICICNDLYVPALRQLKQQALVINVPTTIPTTLAGRLMEISRQEKIRADLTTLVALCEKTDNDIRSCLNTLQFLKSKSSDLSSKIVESLSLGQKDSHKSLFSVWQHIFTLPKVKRKRYTNPHDRAGNPDLGDDLSAVLAADNTTPSARFQHTLQMVYAAGESQKLLQGLFENYLESKVKDHRMMDSILLALEWMEFTDYIDGQIQVSQNYSLMRYVSYLPVLFHLLFATNHPQKITYPHTQYEIQTRTARNTSLVTAMVTDMVPSVRKNLNMMIAAMEIIPPLLSIIQPSLRPVNTQLYSTKEKECLSQLIQVMIGYNMTYHQERSQDGQYNYILDPNMDEVARFPGLKQTRQLTYAAKQLIAREIELEKMRRSEAALGCKQRAIAAPPSNSAEPQNAPKEIIPNHKRQILKPKLISENLPVVDFFGRKVVLTAKVQEQKEEKSRQETIGGDIWFKFKEGFTNAVRKTVRIKDLL